jgi:DNA-binding protein Fis
MKSSTRKKRTEEQLQQLHKICCEFSLRELVDEKIEQILNQMESVNGNSSIKGDIYGCVMRTIEESLINQTMNKMKGNRTRTAEILGINRNTLRHKMNGKFSQ